MDFSIVIPTYNRAAIIGKAVESVLRQVRSRRNRAEIVLVDDSNDDTLEVAAETARQDPACELVTFRGPTRLGVTGARNKGIELASGDVLIFLDSDDELTDGSLDYIDRFFAEHAEIALLFGRIVNKSGRAARCREDFLNREVSYEELIQVDGVGEFLPIVRRSALIESGLRYAVETEGSEGILWRRIPRAGYKVWYTSEVLRLYDDLGADRNSTPKLRVKRARVFAKGHLLELREFGGDLAKLNRQAFLKKVLKATIYNRLALPPDAAADAYLREHHPGVFHTARLLPAPLVRTAFEWSVKAKLAGWL